MSVLACDRQGCENIMCDYYSHEFGYICRECLSELDSLQPTTYSEIAEFMYTDKEDEKFKLNSLDIYFIFTMRE